MTRAFGLMVVGLMAMLLTGCSAGWNPADFNRGAPAGTGFQVHPLPGTERKYGVYIPHDYNPSKSYPTVLFLHGLFENGTDPTEAMLVGVGPVVAEKKLAADFIIIFPIARSDWRSEDELKLAKRVLDDVKSHYSVDPNRVSLTGVSMGGYGTWALAQMYPTEFCALSPMAAFSKPGAVPAIKGIPVWIWHNSGDIFVSPGDAKEMERLLKAAGGNVRLTMNSSAAHNVWVAAYRDPEYWNWVRAQNRGN